MWTYVKLLVFLWFIGLSLSHGELSSKDYMLCGGLSTAITDILLFPVDTIKVTQQSTAAGLTMTQAIRNIRERGGVGAFYKGALGYSFFDGCGAAIFFAVYERIKGLAAEHLTGPLLATSNYGSAGAAFMASSLLLVPAEVLKTRMQTQGFRCFRDCLRNAVSEPRGGVLGLYKGYKATLIRDLPYFALQLGFYDSMRGFISNFIEKNSRKDQDHQSNHHLTFPLPPLNQAAIDIISGVGAGFLTGVLTNPADVVTARLMTQTADHAKELLPAFRASINAPYTGFRNACVRIFKKEGPQAFMSGMGARVAWISPFVAISLCLNNIFRREIEKNKQLGLDGSGVERLGRGHSLGRLNQHQQQA